MTLLPIVDRELRVAARRLATHRSRLVTVLAAAVGWTVLLLAGGQTAPARLGQHLFAALHLGAFGICLLAGIFLTADSLSAEKRDGTLGLLFLTDLRGYDVVLGKLAVTSLHAIYVMIGILPLLGTPLLLGGVTGGEFARIVLVLLVTLMLSLTAGLAVSAATQETRHAMGRTASILIALAVLLPAVWWLLPTLVRGPRMSSAVLWPCPGYGLVTARDGAYATAAGRDDYWGSIVTCAVLSLGALGYAAWVLPRRWRDESSKRPTKPEAAPSAAPGAPSWPGRVLRQFSNPARWLAERGGSPSRLALVGVGITLAVWAVGLIFFSRAFSNTPLFMFSFGGAFLLHQLFKAGLVIDATRRLHEDRQSGALELLLITPLAPAAILEAHAEAVRGRCRRFKGVLVPINVVTMIAFLCSPWINPTGIDIVMGAGLFLGGILLLFADAHALLWLGLENALTAPRHAVAVGRTLRQVMGWSWACVFLFLFMGFGGALKDQETVAGLIWLWVVAGAGAGWGQGSRARRALEQNFRPLAAAEPHPTRPWLSRVARSKPSFTEP